MISVTTYVQCSSTFKVELNLICILVKKTKEKVSRIRLASPNLKSELKNTVKTNSKLFIRNNVITKNKNRA